MSTQPRDDSGKFAAKTDQEEKRQDSGKINGENTVNSGSRDAQSNFNDRDTKSLLEELRNQNQLLLEQNASLQKKMEEAEAERRAEKLTVAVNQKKEALKSLSPRLAEKYKDEVNLDKLDLLIDSAKELRSGIGDYSVTGEPKKERDYPTRFNPITGKNE